LRPNSESLLESAAVGNIGVRLFFVLSGFLITHLLLREEAKTGNISLRAFYIRRAFRIFPACWFYVLVMLLLWAFGIRVLSRLSIWSSLLYFSNYVRWNLVAQPLRHLWSLSVEEQFYLIWPMMFILLPRYRTRVLALVILVAPFWRLAIFLHPEWHFRETIDRRFDAIADCIASGCLLALIRDGGQYSRLFARRWLYVPALLAVAGGFTSAHPRLYYLLGQTALNIGLAVCIDAAVRFQESSLFRWLGWTPVAIVGLISYSLYLWQQIFLADNTLGFSGAALRLMFSIIAAIFSFVVIEWPMRRLGSRMSGRLKRTKAGSRLEYGVSEG
jgi:peptidoglycan/LPS O-acetylase OafA/YrhL